jgi:hypothetical protein
MKEELVSVAACVESGGTVGPVSHTLVSKLYNVEQVKGSENG